MSQASKTFVSRTALAEALRFISTAGKKALTGPAFLRVHSGTLTLERAGQSRELEVEGEADFDAQFELAYAAFASKLPDEDPLEIAFDGSHLSFGRYRHPARAANKEDPLDAVAARVQAQRVARAVAILSPYGVKIADIQPLFGTTSQFAEGEQALTDRVAKAWAELAPYGVKPESLKEIISQNLRNAWRR
jgi:hypothetical protein